MSEKKKIPCRVCGTLFEPCSYCQSHADIFRWRNFACSRACAAKYMNDTIAYRESLKNKEEIGINEIKDHMDSSETKTSVKRKHSKKNSTKFIEHEENEINIENNETE